MKRSELPKVTRIHYLNPFSADDILSTITNYWSNDPVKITFKYHGYTALPACGRVYCQVKGVLRIGELTIFQFNKIGKAELRKGDTYDEEKGKQIARAVAEKKVFEYCERRLRYASKVLADRQNILEKMRDKCNKMIDHQIDYLKTF